MRRHVVVGEGAPLMSIFGHESKAINGESGAKLWGYFQVGHEFPQEIPSESLRVASLRLVMARDLSCYSSAKISPAIPVLSTDPPCALLMAHCVENISMMTTFIPKWSFFIGKQLGGTALTRIRSTPSRIESSCFRVTLKCDHIQLVYRGDLTLTL